MARPAGWQPPAQWTPPANAVAPSTPLQHDPARAVQRARKSVRGVLWSVGCTVLLSILVPGIIVAFVFSKTTDAIEGVASGAGSGQGSISHAHARQGDAGARVPAVQRTSTRTVSLR